MYFYFFFFQIIIVLILNRIELVKEKDLALQEKNKLKEIIKKYENDFLLKNGRALQKDDREYYKDDFEKYKVIN